MSEIYLHDETIERKDSLPKGDYENCVFRNCHLAEAILSSSKFISCTFEGCNLSLAKIAQTSFQDVTFRDCKLLGLRFDGCNDFGLSLSFECCLLNDSSFYKLKLKKTVFKDSQLKGTDLAEADLTGAVFAHCDLAGALFDQTLLEKADFRTAINYSIDPELNRIKHARFSLSGVSGLLSKYDIHIEM